MQDISLGIIFLGFARRPAAPVEPNVARTSNYIQRPEFFFFGYAKYLLLRLRVAAAVRFMQAATWHAEDRVQSFTPRRRIADRERELVEPLPTQKL